MKNKLRILVLSPSYPRHEKDSRVPFVRSFVKEIAKNNIVTVITSSATETKKNYQVMDNVKVHRFNYFFPQKLQKLSYTESGGILESYKKSFLAKIQMPFFLLSFFLKAKKHAKDCDIIDAEWLLSALIAIPLKILYKKPIVCTVRGAGLRSMPTFLRRYITRRTDIFISWTPELTALLNSLGRKKGIVDIKQMIDFDKLKKKSNIQKFKKELNLKNEKIITFLGRMVHMKNPIGFIKSIPYVIKKRKDIKFLMVGDGELKQEAEKLIKKLKIEKYILLTGNRSDVNNVLRATDIFVALSPICHTYSATIMEAMFLGTPTILDTPKYTKENFTHKKYAYLVPNNNPEALADAILTLLKDKKLYSKLSSNAPKFVKKLGFEKKVIIEKTLNLYKKLQPNK
jgi:glycosyltransferase involved in cell wall biosynthesis